MLEALTPRSRHISHWREAKKILNTMKFVKKDGKHCVVPSITNWILTLDNFEYLAHKLFHEYQCKSLWLRHFNQDPLENFFGCVRAHGVRNTNPTSSCFENSFAALLINNLNSIHSAGSICEKDMCSDKMFQSLRNLFFKNKTKITEQPIIDFNHLDADNIILDFKNKIKDLKVKSNISYVTGFVIKKLKRIFKNCNICNACFCGNTNSDCLDYIRLRDYSLSNKYLTYPSFEAMECFSQQQDIIYFILRDSIDMCNLKMYLKTVLSTICDYNFIKCNEHKNVLVEAMQDLLCRFFICNWCRQSNNVLKGIRSDIEKEDKVQLMCQQYYQKRLKKK